MTFHKKWRDTLSSVFHQEKCSWLVFDFWTILYGTSTKKWYVSLQWFRWTACIFKFSTFALLCLRNKENTVSSSLSIAQWYRCLHLLRGKKHIPFARRCCLLFSIPMENNILVRGRAFYGAFVRTTRVCQYLFVGVDVAFVHQLSLDWNFVSRCRRIFHDGQMLISCDTCLSDNCLSVWS